MSSRRVTAHAIGSAIVVALLVSPPTASAQEPTCDLSAERWEDEGQSVRLHQVRASCGEIEITAASAVVDERGLLAEGADVLVITPEGRLRTNAVRVEGGALSAQSGCLETTPERRVECCGTDVERTPRGAWTVVDATCEIEGGMVTRARRVSLADGAIRFSSATSARPIALPLRVRHLDTTGRSSGFVSPVLGYRTERGLGTRIDWYQPFGEALDLVMGVFGATVGAAGVAPTLRWSQAERSDSATSGVLAYDASRERPFRAALDADASLTTRSALGLTVVGEIWSDTRMGQDFGASSTVTRRPDRHLSAVGWAGGRFDRFYAGVFNRQVDPVAATDSERARAPDHLGTMPAVGYVVSAPLGAWGSIGADMRFDRFAGRRAEDASNELRMVVGGALRALSWPALSVFPGLWMVVAAAFDNPGSDAETYRYYGTLLRATVDIESPWIGGGPSAWHLVTFRASGAVDAYEAMTTEGEPPAAQPRVADLAPYRFAIGVDQTVRSDGVQLHLPLDWLAHADNDGLTVSRLSAALRLVVGAGDWRFELAQIADLDLLDSRRFCCWTGGTALRRQTATGRSNEDGLPTGQRGVGFGGSVTLIRSGSTLTPGLQVLLPPLLRQSGPSSISDGARVARAWLNADLGPAGVAAQAAWPLGLADAPDVTGALWIGRIDQIRLLLNGGYLGDGTVIAQLSLAQGTFQPWGPWAGRF